MLRAKGEGLYALCPLLSAHTADTTALTDLPDDIQHLLSSVSKIYDVEPEAIYQRYIEIRDEIDEPYPIDDFRQVLSDWSDTLAFERGFIRPLKLNYTDKLTYDKMTVYKSAGTARIPAVASSELNIPADIMELAARVGKRYGITGQQICERYLQICKRSAFDGDAITDLRDNVLLDIDGKEESWEAAFVKPIKAGVLTEPMKQEQEHNPTPELSELPKFEDAVPIVEDALKVGRYPLRPFVLYETEHEQYSVISFADTAKRYLNRPQDAKARGTITMLAWHLQDGWWRS